MKKLLKRTFRVLFILIVFIIAALIIVPIVFKPQLMELAKREINSNVNTKVEFKDFQVSLIKGFPNLYVGLKGLTLVGNDSFAKDTLVSFNELSVKVALMSVFGMKNIEVKSILLDKPKFTAHINHKGNANWGIVKPPTDTSTAQQSKEIAAESQSTLNVALRKFEIREANIKYIDDSSSISATVGNLNFLLSGNMGMDFTILKVKTTIETFTFTKGGMKYINKARIGFSGDIGADIVNRSCTFKDNEFYLNAIALNFAGSMKMPKDDIDVDVTFNTNKADFKSILSLIPAIYMKDFEGLQASGKFNLNGFAKGIYNDKAMPSAGVELLVEDAMFKYPALPKLVDNINVDAKVNFDGINTDNTKVDINRFYVEMAGNPFDAEVHVSTPMSDMQVAGLFKGKIDFTSIADIIPLDSMKIKGLLETNIQFGGRMSYFNKQQYEKFKANGTMKLTSFEFSSPDLPQGFNINETTINFSPKYADILSFDSRIGKSDLKLNGRFENYIPYFFSNQTIKGNLTISSNLLDANEFLSEKATPVNATQVKLDTVSVADTKKEKTNAMSVIEIPKNIDFTMMLNINHISYDKVDISNLNGKLLVKDGKVNMDNLSMNMLDGSLVASGEYNTQSIKKPAIAFDMKVNGFDIPTTIKSLSMLSKIASSANDVKGKVSTQFTMTATLDSTMSLIYYSINAKGKLQSNSIELTNSKIFGTFADILKNESLRDPVMKDVNLSFAIRDGRIYIEPFDTKISSSKMNIGGDMGLDQTLNFKAKVSIPRSSLGPANDLIDILTSKVASKGLKVKLSENINLNLKIRGTATNPEIIPDWGGSNDDSMGATNKETDNGHVKRYTKEEADKLIADAEKVSERLKVQAAELADKLRKEANRNADKIESEGDQKGGFAAQAASAAAKLLRKEGEAAALKVIQEADVKGNAVVEKAKLETENVK